MPDVFHRVEAPRSTLYQPADTVPVVIDWSQCPDVERSADTLHGAWRVKGHRVPVQAILENAEDCTPEQIAGPHIYPSIPVDVVRRILDFARAAR